MNGVIFHKNGEISEAANKEAEEKLLSFCHCHILALCVYFLAGTVCVW